MSDDRNIVILDGARRTPRADILVDNREPGLFSRYATTALGGLAITATLEHTPVERGLVGHVIMGMASHSHRDSIYAAQGMAWRAGLDHDVPALTVARICGSGAEANHLIAAGQVKVDGQVQTRKRCKLRRGQEAAVADVRIMIV